MQQQAKSSRNSSSHQDRQATIRPSIELDSSDSDSESSSNIVIQYQHKWRRYTRGIKVTPSYTLKVSSSLREQGDWKKDIEQVFEGDPYTYQTRAQKILKALDYLDSDLKSLQYTYSNQKSSIKQWPVFLGWTRDNIQNRQNATTILYK